MSTELTILIFLKSRQDGKSFISVSRLYHIRLKERLSRGYILGGELVSFWHYSFAATDTRAHVER